MLQLDLAANAQGVQITIDQREGHAAEKPASSKESAWVERDFSRRVESS
jgi:hypothetical protein